jgi:hypothetical protein
MSSIGRRAFARILFLASGLIFTGACGNDLTTTARAPETPRLDSTIDPTAWYAIYNSATNKVMDVENAGCCNGYYVHQWTYEGQPNQQWRIEAVGGGYYKVVARHSNRVLDVSNASMSDGARVHQWGYDGSANQQFSFLYVGGDYWTIVARHSGKVLALGTSSGSIYDNGVGVRQYGTTNYGVWRLVKVQ